MSGPLRLQHGSSPENVTIVHTQQTGDQTRPLAILNGIRLLRFEFEADVSLSTIDHPSAILSPSPSETRPGSRSPTPGYTATHPMQTVPPIAKPNPIYLSSTILLVRRPFVSVTASLGTVVLGVCSG